MLSVINVAFKRAQSVHDIFKHNIKNNWLPIPGAAWRTPGEGSVMDTGAQVPRSASSTTARLRQQPQVLVHIPVPPPRATARAELDLPSSVTELH